MFEIKKRGLKSKKSLASKKGQIYILVALVLSGLAFSMIINRHNASIVSKSSFDKLSKQYLREASYSLNYAQYHDKDLFNNLKDYTNYFIKYSSTVDNVFGLVYIFTQDNKTEISNYIKSDIYIKSDLNSTYTLNLFNGVSPNRIELDNVDNITLTYNGQDYFYKIKNNNIDQGQSGYQFSGHQLSYQKVPDIKVLFVSAREGEVNIKAVS